jgi:hypothetical protein
MTHVTSEAGAGLGELDPKGVHAQSDRDGGLRPSTVGRCRDTAVQDS